MKISARLPVNLPCKSNIIPSIIVIPPTNIIHQAAIFVFIGSVACSINKFILLQKTKNRADLVENYFIVDLTPRVLSEVFHQYFQGDIYFELSLLRFLYMLRRPKYKL